MIPSALLAGDAAYRLPDGSSAAAAPVLRPLPGGGGRLFVGLLGGGALPAWTLPGAARPAAAWALVPGPEGAMLVGGDALRAPVPATARPLPVPPYPPASVRLSQAEEESEAAASPLAAAPPGGFRLALRGATLDLPFAALDRLLPMPPLSALPSAPGGVLGLAWTEAGPALVLDTASVGGEGGEAPLLALILVEGRRVGLPCQGVTPVAGDPPLPPALRHPGRLAEAPVALPRRVEAPAPTRLLLVARAAGTGFALALEEVVAVLPPRTPRYAGSNGDRAGLAGLAAHRGDVLPVTDAGLRLGQGPVLGGGAVPMIRLAGEPGTALAVSTVLGLWRVPEAAIAAVPGGTLVAAMARFEGGVLPVCRAAALGPAGPRGALRRGAP